MTVLRAARLCVVCLAAVVTAGCGPATRSGQAADLEFTMKAGVSAQAKGDLAVALWKLGTVKAVDAPSEGDLLYRVHLEQPDNLLHLQQVHDHLDAAPQVGRVWSLVGWVRR